MLETVNLFALPVYQTHFHTGLFPLKLSALLARLVTFTPCEHLHKAWLSADSPIVSPELCEAISEGVASQLLFLSDAKFNFNCFPIPFQSL